MTLIITDEQIAIRDEWELRLKQNKCNLSDALFMCMSSGAPLTPYLLERFEGVVHAYQSGEIADLAEGFGIAMRKREKNAMERKTKVSNVRFHVDAYHEQGFSKNSPENYDDTAFHQTAKLLKMSTSQIFDLYYDR